jgi:hypothetical protein
MLLIEGMEGRHVKSTLSFLIRRSGLPLRALDVDGWQVTALFVDGRRNVRVGATYFEESTDESIASELVAEALAAGIRASR